MTSYNMERLYFQVKSIYIKLIIFFLGVKQKVLNFDYISNILAAFKKMINFQHHNYHFYGKKRKEKHTSKQDR